MSSICWWMNLSKSMEKKSINQSINHHMTYEVQLHTHHQKGQWHHSNANTALSHHHQQLSMYPLCTRFQTFSLFPLAHKQNTTLPLHSTNHSEMLMLLQPTYSIQGFPHWEQHLSGGANLRTSKKNYIGETKHQRQMDIQAWVHTVGLQQM